MATPPEHEPTSEVSSPKHNLESSRDINHAFTWLLSLAPTDMLSKRTLAERFGVDERTIQRWVARGELPPSAFGNGGMKYWLVGHIVECLRRRFDSVFNEAKRRAERFLILLLNVGL